VTESIASATPSSSLAPPPPRTPEEKTLEIARHAARSLTSYELGAKMCELHEVRREPVPHDAWGTPFRVRCDLKEMNYVFTSAGADRTFGTPDDVQARHMSGAISVFRHVK
jgi:hypothetical protein